ncbi:VWA domain-containing protein [Promicromonospora kroppenstedtii]|uniref:VWA domain-containing protein n=1 Tax=Promicromonospora kroppenstedtii TaxID=440482 RepID=UPI0004BCD8D3|nr:VWA domain-containing protein [Promicromonospora kroppenstedtii]
MSTIDRTPSDPAVDASSASSSAGLVAGPSVSDGEAARRWRLVLGRYAADELQVGQQDQGLERSLRYLYDREYTARGHRVGRGGPNGEGGRSGGGAGLGGSQPHGVDVTALGWLNEAGSLFPRETFERMQVDAVSRYGLTELLQDETALETLEPSRELAVAMLQVRGALNDQAANGLRRIIRRVVDDVVKRLRPRFTTAVNGRIDRSRRSMHRVARNFDWKRTLRANLGRVDADGRMMVQDVRFSARAKRTLTWDVILLVDQSGSMAPSLLYSAVCAGILSGLPGINVQLYLFDTSVVDMSHLAADPVEVLMTAQLGGGTDIARAVRHAEQQVRNPSRTVVALVSDFYEGGSVSSLLTTVRRMASSGVTMLGLAALDEAAEPVYDQGTARNLAECGMEVAALTPERFAEWLGEVLS